MPKYRVHLQTVVSYTAEVEAADAEAALEEAFETVPHELYAGTHEQSQWIDIGEWGAADEGFTVDPSPAVEVIEP